ncbi:Multiple inositol polyphosphate phosphatase 1 [Gryllus bimaculatus]|nr:Multiple inositol polyphosphate phosphatase 1 [Gryllus bimaculatus]
MSRVFTVQFRHTDSQRTQESARQFARGLFTDADVVNIPPAGKKDLLLQWIPSSACPCSQPYTECKLWLEGDKSDPPEWRKLVDGSLMQSLIANVSSRLGFRSDLKFGLLLASCYYTSTEVPRIRVHNIKFDLLKTF